MSEKNVSVFLRRKQKKEISEFRDSFKGHWLGCWKEYESGCEEWELPSSASHSLGLAAAPLWKSLSGAVSAQPGWDPGLTSQHRERSCAKLPADQLLPCLLTELLSLCSPHCIDYWGAQSSWVTQSHGKRHTSSRLLQLPRSQAESQRAAR